MRFRLVILFPIALICFSSRLAADEAEAIKAIQAAGGLVMKISAES